MEQQKCLRPGLTASQTSSPEQNYEPGCEPDLETESKERTGSCFLQQNSKISGSVNFTDSGDVSTWRNGVLLSWRVFRGWTSGVLPVLLAEDPETEA